MQTISLLMYLLGLFLGFCLGWALREHLFAKKVQKIILAAMLDKVIEYWKGKYEFEKKKPAFSRSAQKEDDEG